jgi:2-polyprenyl-3-methyl-5-hydroxy-6-metoxy-1,4-benzoquinol methylase
VSRACPVCGGTRRFTFLERERVPAFQNVPCATAEEARAIPRAALRLAACEDCGFVANDAFDEQAARYASDYENEQCHSGVFEAHVESLVEGLVRAGVVGKRVLEAGCGTGAFLRRLCRDGGNVGIGYDPAYRGPSEDLGSAVRFVADYYVGQPEGKSADVVVSRHVIEHVADPRALLRAMHAACKGGAKLLLETPDVEWILAQRVVEDFFHEHCSYFTTGALVHAVESEGFRVTRQVSLFGGQYQWLEGVAEAVASPARLPDASRVARVVALARCYDREVPARIAALERRIAELGRDGAVAVWGAGAKGVTLVNLCDPECRLVACVVDINPRKQRRFVPGTGHPIVAPETLREMGVRHVIVMNPNYEQEIGMQAGAVDAAIRIHVADRL